MLLTLHIDENTQTVDIPDTILSDGVDFFKTMDADMDKGWQMSREWIENPNTDQRCQIAADKMLNAFSSENETMVMLMAGYIFSHIPDIKGIRFDTAGEIHETELLR